MSKLTWGIWVGHGKSTDGSWDPGAVYKGWTEAERALLITQAFITAMRTSGETVYTDAFDGNNKNMIKQVEMSNSKKVDVHIAIHLDWSGAPSGTLGIHYPGSTEGKKLAKCLCDAVKEEIGLKTRGTSGRSDLYEVKQTKMTAAIFECGSIKVDIKYFDTEAECTAFGKALAKGACEYAGIKYKEKTTVTKKVKYPTNSYAKKIKQGLKTLGYYNGAIDSYVTPEYTAAVLKFQKDAFTRAKDKDGIGGNDTWIAVQNFVNCKDLKYFEPEEFRCTCGHCTGYPAVMDKQLLKNIEYLRKDSGAPITITSGLRCKWKNSRLSGSSSTSKHMIGKALDFYSKVLTNTKAKRTAMVKRWYTFKKSNYSYANTPGMGNAVHVDVK